MEKKTHTSVTVTMVRDRKIRTVLRTNQIVGFVTVPAWKKIKRNILEDELKFKVLCPTFSLVGSQA